MNKIVIHGAREHNLKNVDIELPRDKFIVITGLSGSGKSTLAFDTIYAEGQRRYVESLSAYARQFLGVMNKPDVDSIEGLSPAISIDQKTTSHNPRSTVGTVTEIYDYLRLLFARIGTPHCPTHGIEIASQSAQKIAERISEECKGVVVILAPIIQQKKGTYEKLFEDLNKDGYTKVRVDGKLYKSDSKIILEKFEKHDIEIVIDRSETSDIKRLNEAVENAVKKSELVIALDEKNVIHTYSSKMACPVCGVSFEELQPRMFSFNSPFGACEECNGLGIKMEFDDELIIPDKSLSIADGAIAVYRNVMDGWRAGYLANVAKSLGFTMLTPINKLTKKQYVDLMYGSSKEIKFNMKMNNGDTTWSGTRAWEGLLPQTERLYKQTESEYRKQELEKFMRISECPKCKGRRLKDKILAVMIKGKNIADITDMPISQASSYFKDLKLNEKDESIARLILKEINSRLDFLENVGLNYLSLSRNSGTLSGGESQRIRLATQIGSNLTGVIYILDEPSIGLHQRDNHKLIETLNRLRDLGNTLIVVEHDEETIRSADYIVDMGPGAGINGGRVVAQGSSKDIERSAESITGQYLSGKLKIEVPKKRRVPNSFMHFLGCKEHNLKNINVKIPMSVLSVVSGVSGSGKSTLVNEIIYKGLMQRVHGSKEEPGKHDKIILERPVDKVIKIDQSPIGRTPRSNPATYTKVFDEVRNLFASTKEAKMAGYDAGRFSFNVSGGRCEACEGDGVIKIEMNFLPDVYVECDECKGKRYNHETLRIKYKGKNIADILNMTVDEALEIFSNVPSIKKKLEFLNSVGLNYIKLGQSATKLSGGEAQRIKLTRELAKRDTGSTVYLLDEPTTGLHFHDVKKLLGVINALVEKGNTVLIIEHNLDVIKSADYIIDLGPEGGDRGGELIAEGTPEEVSKNALSYTGNFLLKMIK